MYNNKSNNIENYSFPRNFRNDINLYSYSQVGSEKNLKPFVHLKTFLLMSLTFLVRELCPYQLGLAVVSVYSGFVNISKVNLRPTHLKGPS